MNVPCRPSSFRSSPESCYLALSPLRGWSIELGAIPASKIGPCLIRTLKELQNHFIRGGCRPHQLVGENEVAELAAIVGAARPDPRRSEARRFGARVRVERGLCHRAAAWPKPDADLLVRIRLAEHGRVAVLVLGRTPAVEAREGEIEGAPEEMHGTRFPEKSPLESFHDPVCLHQDPKESIGLTRGVGGVETILDERDALSTSTGTGHMLTTIPRPASASVYW